MYSCNKCGKGFPTPSKLDTHKNRKTSCDEPKPYLKCDLCDVKFIRPAEKLRHENTKKHIENLNTKLDDNFNLKNNNIRITNLENINSILNNINTNFKNTINDLENKIKHLEVGRTGNIRRRHGQYPPGSELLYSFSCKDSKTIENLILNYLEDNTELFNQVDFGREYFQCELKDLKNVVLKFVD